MTAEQHRGRPPAGTASKQGTDQHRNQRRRYLGAPSQRGLERAIRVSRRDWEGDGVHRAIVELARAGRPFDADDVRAIVGEKSSDARMFAAAFAAAQRAGLIECVSAVIDRSGRPARVWNNLQQSSEPGQLTP